MLCINSKQLKALPKLVRFADTQIMKFLLRAFNYYFFCIWQWFQFNSVLILYFFLLVAIYRLVPTAIKPGDWASTLNHHIHSAIPSIVAYDDDDGGWLKLIFITTVNLVFSLAPRWLMYDPSKEMLKRFGLAFVCTKAL